VNARQMYEAERSPHHRADYEGGVQEARGESAMGFTTLESAEGVVETFAGAPDWLFGRGCLKEVRPHLPSRGFRRSSPNRPPPSRGRCQAAYAKPAAVPAEAPGRCVVGQVKDVLPVLQKMGPLTDVDTATREMLGPQCGSVPGFSEDRPPQPLTMPAPGRLGHALVGVHFVYRHAGVHPSRACEKPETVKRGVRSECVDVGVARL